MNIVVFPYCNRTIHANFTGARAVAGALKFPAFLLVWSVGVVLATGVYLPADALVRQAPIEFKPLQQLASLNDHEALSFALEQELRGASVVAGDWQPPVAETEAETVETAKAVANKAQLPSMAPPQIQPRLQQRALQMTRTPIVVDEAVADSPKPGAADGPLVVKRTAVSGHRITLMKRDARRALAAGDKQIAYRDLMTGLEAGAGDSEYLGLLALAALASGYAAEALIVYERLVVMEPDNEQWWAGLAVSKERLGLEAASVYQEALARSAQNSRVQQLALTRLQGLG